MSSEFNLPNCLLIILHLHLLNYPLQNAAGYDERLFDPSRGMRERSKTMEDISYFLVGKIEGGKERAKVILPTYPCLQPSATSAFRIALTKYLEGLRNAIVHTTHLNHVKSRKQPISAEGDDVVAWWWRDVVVRKSVLDECCGDRFERLMLALSSHAILKNTTSTLQSSSTRDRGEVEHDLSTLSRVYTSALAAARNTRLGWERPAALLVQRQFDLAAIHARIADPKLSTSSKYDSLATDRLLSLRDSRQKDLFRGFWDGEEGHLALQLITEIAGLVDPSAFSFFATGLASEIARTGTQSRVILHTSQQTDATTETPSPLPIAAARHPAHLHSFGLPLFPKVLSSSSSNENIHNIGLLTSHAITERRAVIESVQVSLQTALENAQKIHAHLQRRLQKGQDRTASRPPAQKQRGTQLQLDATIWDRRVAKLCDFEKVPDASFVAKFGLAMPPSENAVEERIAHIRTAILSPFTADPIPASESDSEAMPAPQEPSQLRPPSSRIHAPKASSGLGKLAPTGKVKPSGPSRQGHVVKRPEASRIPLVTSQRVQIGQKVDKAARRMSRRASAVRTRRSTVFGHGEAAEILRIVESVQDCSDSEEDDVQVPSSTTVQLRPHTNVSVSAHTARTPVPKTPARGMGTRGMLLSTTQKSVPRQSFDIDKYERINIPRLPSLHLETPPEREEDDRQAGAFLAGIAQAGAVVADQDKYMKRAAEDDNVAYDEGNSMTLADILLNAANTSMHELLGEDELEYTSD